MKHVGAPETIVVKTLADYLETMSKSVFQTGISWKLVEAKWPDGSVKWVLCTFPVTVADRNFLSPTSKVPRPLSLERAPHRPIICSIGVS